MANYYTKSVTIADSGTVSGAVQLCDAYNDDVDSLVGVVTAAAFTTADLTFQFSHDGTTYTAAKNAAGTAITLSSVAASEWRAVDPTDFISAKYIKVVSSVAQSGGDTITLVMRGVA